MNKIKIEGGNGRDTLYIKGTPNIRILSRQDYNSFITELELEIREYYKNDAKISNKPPP
jgi:hypothetical protein